MRLNPSRRLLFCALTLSLAATMLASCRRGPEAVVARVGSAAITAADWQERLRSMPPAYQQYMASAEGRRKLLDLMVREKLLGEEARRAGLHRDGAYRRAVRQFEEQARQRAREYRETLLVDSYLRRLRATDLKVADEAVGRYYDEHRAEFMAPLEVSAHHILVPSEAEGQAALARLRRGESFDAVARALSRDPATAARGGRLSPFRRGQLVPAFEEAAFRLRPGQTSGLVQTQFGFHIIRKTGERKLPALSLDQARDAIRARLERDQFEQWVARKQSGLSVRINERALAAAEAALKPAEELPQEPPKP